MAEADAAQPKLNVISQYVRRVVFENSAAINGVAPKNKPTINIQVNVEAEKAEDDIYRVGLLLTIETMDGENEIFAVELDYFGLFRLSGIPEQSIAPVLYVQCPILLFPFARQIIADATRDGGYQPLLLDPINFEGMYRSQVMEKQNGADA